jgi:hypothetical protein
VLFRSWNYVDLNLAGTLLFAYRDIAQSKEEELKELQRVNSRILNRAIEILMLLGEDTWKLRH